MSKFAFPKDMTVEARKAMTDYVMVYVNHVRGLLVHKDCILHVEVKVRVNDQIWGTADAIVWDPRTKTLFIVDLKFGAGVGVEVAGNLQLRIYALAALLTMGYPAETINVGIVQPRYGHSDGPCRSVDFDAMDLLDFFADLKGGVKRVEAASRDAIHDQSVYGYTQAYWIEKYLHASEKGCRWCLAAPECPLVKAKAQKLAKQVFAPQQPYNKEALAETLAWAPILKAWIANVDAFAYAEAEQGHDIPGFKLVEKRATRKWQEHPNVFLLTGALNVPANALYKPQELRPVGELTKLAPGRNAAEREAVLAPFTVKESSGHALVPVSDPREPVRVDAKSVFSQEPV